MGAFIRGLDAFIAALRGGFGVLVVSAGALMTLAWAVRARRIQPFSGIGRFTRKVADPIIAPVERRIVRAGGTSASAPWWTLVFVLIAGLALLALLGFVRDLLVSLSFASSRGPGGLLRLAVSWTFGVFQLALLVRVVTSWVGGAWSRIGRLAWTMTEWFLAPLRRVLPALGAFDISPLVAWFALSLLQGIVMRAL